MKRFALIGHPVAGSLSPRLFTAAYEGRYPYDLIDAPFDEAWARFLADYHGINVTAPYKQDAFRAVDVLSDGARECGAVNLVLKAPDGLLHGYNTDVDGVVGAVRETGFQPSDTLIIGAGGAAMAAVVGAKILGSGTITIANRTYEKAAALAAAHSCNAVPLDAIGTLSPDLVIYNRYSILDPDYKTSLYEYLVFPKPDVSHNPYKGYYEVRSYELEEWSGVKPYRLDIISYSAGTASASKALQAG